MLGKLMKYELRATSRTMLPLLLLTLLLSVFARVSTGIVQSGHTKFMQILNALIIFAFILALIGTAVFSVVLMVVRFHKNLMTDEGYLMFALPVSVHQLLWSKLLVSMLWFVAVFLVDGLAVLLTIFEAGMFSGFPEFIRNVFDSLNRYYTVNGLLYMLELFGVLLVSMVTACLMFYAPIAIGNSFATHKTLLSVVFYFVIQTVLQIVSLFGIAGAANVVTPLLSPAILDNSVKMAHLVFTSALAYSLVVGAVLYVLTWFMLRKRLNLQ